MSRVWRHILTFITDNIWKPDLGVTAKPHAYTIYCVLKYISRNCLYMRIRLLFIMFEMVSCWFYFSDGFFSSLFLLGACISETFCAPFACFAKQDQQTNGHTKGLIHSFFFLFFYIVFQQNKQTFIVVIGENLRFSISFFHVILHSITLKVNWNRLLYAHYSKLLTLFCHPFASLFRWFALF